MDLQRLALLTTPYMEYGDHYIMGFKEMMQEIGLCELKQEQVWLAGLR